jgi:hypothetical protein
MSNPGVFVRFNLRSVVHVYQWEVEVNSRPDSIAASLILIITSVVHLSEPFRDIVIYLALTAMGYGCIGIYPRGVGKP